MGLTKIMQACTNEHLSNFESISNRSPVCALENFKEPFNTTNLLPMKTSTFPQHTSTTPECFKEAQNMLK